MIPNLSGRVLEELSYFMFATKLGQGMSREVFLHPHDPTKVIKIENSCEHFQNVKEWEFWNVHKLNKNVSKWLAPCHYISDSGTFLIMDKTEVLPKNKIPKLLPGFLTDHKPENFGLLNGRVVCHDYSFMIYNLEMRLRKWRGTT